uniref:C3H1-type domain-containing protein n=1 Tax=Proboscia inermis TaxID=420281 RepID=A0A7S0GBH4_9STRA
MICNFNLKMKVIVKIKSDNHDSSSSPTKAENDTPILIRPDWMLPQSKHHRCHAFTREGRAGCNLGSKCKYSHVFTPTKEVPSISNRSDIFDIYHEYFGFHLKDADIHEKAECMSCRTWYTSGLICPKEGTIYYAAYGSDFHKSPQGVFWYKNSDSAITALAGVIKSALDNRIVKDTSAQNARSIASNSRIKNDVLPFIQRPDWMIPAHKWNKCRPFLSNGARGCNLGVRCTFAHVHMPNEAALPHIETRTDVFFKTYYELFGFSLKESDIKRKVEVTVSGHWYTAGFACPKYGTIYYSAGAYNSYRSSQGLFWYKSFSDAVSALGGIFLIAWGKYHAQSQSHLSPPQKKQRTSSLPPLPAETDLQCLYRKLFPKCNNLSNKSFHVESTHINSKRYFTAMLLSSAEQGKVYAAEGNGGLFYEDKWWYNDEKIARRACFPVLFVELERARKIKCAYSMSRWRKSHHS